MTTEAVQTELPDLVVTGIYFDKDPAKIRVRILNQGNAPAGKCYVALISNAAPDDASLSTKQRVWTIEIPPLAAHKGFSNTISVSPLTQANGPWKAIVDRSNDVRESNESNNEFTLATTDGNPDRKIGVAATGPPRTSRPVTTADSKPKPQASFASARKTDLSARRALYFTGQKTEKIDLKNDKYVVANKAITLKKSEATACDSEGCTFNVGFIAFRTNPVGAVSTYGLLSVAGAGLVGNTVYFFDKETTRQGVLPLKLKLGRNKVTFQIDPYNKTPETDKTNNSFSVWIIVGP